MLIFARTCGLGYFLNMTLNRQNFAFEFGICNYERKDPIKVDKKDNVEIIL